MKTKFRTTSTTKATAVLSRSELLSILRADFPSLQIQANASVSVRVPSGGDWSGAALDLAETEIVIEWTTATEEESQ